MRVRKCINQYLWLLYHLPFRVGKPFFLGNGILPQKSATRGGGKQPTRLFATGLPPGCGPLDFSWLRQVVRSALKTAFLVFRPAAISLLTAILLVSAGCGPGDDKITVYRIPKETQPTAPQESVADNIGAAPDVHWKAPSAWEEQPATGFRKGSFLVRGANGETADVSVISFPATAGGLLANVNRWRDQLKLAPISNEAEAGTPTKVDGHDMFFVDLVSEQPMSASGSKSRILGGIFPISGATWFFKMAGPDELVGSQRETFQAFLQSVQVAEGSAIPAPMSANIGGNNTNAPTPPPLEAPKSASLGYSLPAGWKEKPLSPMRLASFSAASPNGKEADVSVVSLPATAGGDLANVNRWRGQVKLPPIDEDTLAKSAQRIQANGHDYLMVDLVSDAPIDEQQGKQRILAAILDENGQAWFIKMTGEEATVDAQKSAFVDFLHGLKIP